MRKCKHKRQTTKNEEVGGYNIPEGLTTEYDLICSDCGKYLGHWAYGNTDLEYFFNTAGVFKRFKFYIKDWLSDMKLKIKYRKFSKDNDDDLPF